MMAKEVRMDVAGVSYYSSEDTIISLSTHRRLFDGAPSVGNCYIGELDAEFYPKGTVPRNAAVVPYVRESGAETWTQKSAFHIYSRSTDKETGVLSLMCYDALFRTEESFTRAGDQGEWPRTDVSVAEEIAARIGTTLSAATRTLMTKGYLVQYPGIALEDGTPQYSADGALSMREVLGYVGAMYAGNWIVNNAGELHLAGLGDIPPETHYLIEEGGGAILLGGVRLLV